jgi:hypothetical protein
VMVPPHDRDTFEALRGVFARYRGDRPVSLELQLTEQPRPLRVRAEIAQIRVKPSAGLVAEVERICGQGSVSLLR